MENILGFLDSKFFKPYRNIQNLKPENFQNIKIKIVCKIIKF
jgi:hypothetical protein